MWKLIFFFAILSYISAAPDRLGIIDGSDAREGEFKFAISVRVGGIHLCGGTIINKRFILTASHCVTNGNGSIIDPKYYTIQYGILNISETNDKSVQVKAIYAQPFDFQTFLNDATILELEQDLPDDGTWEPVKLAKTYDTSVDNKGIIIGWGFTENWGPISVTLQKLKVHIYKDSTCEPAYRFNKTQHICLAARSGSACNGDSGGALLTTDKQQIGISSYTTNYDCTSSRESPNVYSRIEYFYDWIQERTKI